MKGVLEGIRVLDFGRYIAGPFCATMLADMGAEVIRIEKVDGSEDRYTVPLGENDVGAGFMQMARNKKSVTLNPMKPAGQEAVKKLVATADVVVANLPAPTLKQMHIDYDSLKAIKLDIILTFVSAFGSAGPYSERVGFDLLGQAMSGAMHVTGSPELPTRTHVPYVDFGTALFAAYGTMAALMHRQQTGEGQIVEAALFHTALNMNNQLLAEQAIHHYDREAQYNRGYSAAPNDCFATTDGWIVTMCVGRPLFERWAKLMGEDGWLDDERFRSDQDRGDHSHLISERMRQWCSERSTEQALRELEEARVPAGPVYDLQQTLDDPHARERGFFHPIDYPGIPGPVPVVDTPVRLSSSPGGIRRRAPTLGEHTAEVLRELGYSDADMEQMRTDRVIR